MLLVARPDAHVAGRTAGRCQGARDFADDVRRQAGRRADALGREPLCARAELVQAGEERPEVRARRCEALREDDVEQREEKRGSVPGRKKT